MILSLKNLSKSFFHRPVINRISFDVNEGDILGIIGRNGIGKSTLLRLLSGLSSGDGGEVHFGEEVLSSGNWKSRDGVLYLGHAPGLYQSFTAVENLTFAAELYKVENIAEKVLNALDKVGLTKQKDDSIKVYSQGMTQRLKLALAMIIPWKILMFDEPFSGLDTQGIQLAESVMNDWKSEKRTMMFVDHNLEFILTFCNRVIMLEAGKIAIDEKTTGDGAGRIRNTFKEIVG